MRRDRLIRIALYYVVAITISAMSRLYWQITGATPVEQGPFAMYLHLVAGAGPALGAATVWFVFRYRSRITVGGTNAAMGVAMIVVPAIVMGIMGVPNGFGVEPHLFGVHMGSWIVVYAILEEIGWRGYLQDEFRDRPALLKYAIVGLFWYAWHLSWLNGNPVGSELVTIVFMIAASAGIGFVADRAGSVLAAASFHAAGDIMWLTADFKTIIPSTATRGTIVIACMIIWLVLLRIWRAKDVRRGSVHRVREVAAP